MALTIVLGLAILSVANYGNTFEFSGLDPSLQSKIQLKPTIKPFSSFTNQPRQGEQAKPAFTGFKNVATKPFGLPFDSFKPSYQPYQPGPFRANYQPFGPYPGYPGPVVYPGQGGFPGPAAYPAPPHHFNDPNQRPFGFQPFPGSLQQSFNPLKYGSTKKFNKNLPGLAEINLPGKYFQEHQFGAYHGPEFSSAIVPAEHSFKQSKPKDTLLGKPAVPALSELGFPKQNVYGFAPPSPSFRYPLPSFPPNQPFFNAVPSTTSAPAATASPAATTAADLRSDFGSTLGVTEAAATPSFQDESATAQQPSEVTGEPSATPAADPQPTAAVPAQEEAAAAGAQVPDNNNETATAAAAADDDTAAKEQQSARPDPVEATEPGAVVGAGAAAQENDAQVSAEKLGSGAVVVEELKETSAAPAATKSGETEENVQGFKPTEAAVPVSAPGLPNELYSPVGDVPASVQPYLGASGYPFNFDQPQPAYFGANFEAPKFTEEDLKRFEESFRDGLSPQQPFQAFVDAAAAARTPGGGSTTPPPAVSGEERAKSDAEGGEKNEAEAPKKSSNTVQIIQDDPFNGQFPLLFDPSNAGGASPLDTYGFYSHPSVSSLSTQASLASYSPEDAFANFGASAFRQGYLVEGSPSLTPVTKTVVASGRVPVSISSEDHPLHSQVFKFSQSFVPYPEVAAFRSIGAPQAATSTTPATAAADAAVTEAQSVVAETTTTAAAAAA